MIWNGFLRLNVQVSDLASHNPESMQLDCRIFPPTILANITDHSLYEAETRGR